MNTSSEGTTEQIKTKPPRRAVRIALIVIAVLLVVTVAAMIPCCRLASVSTVIFPKTTIGDVEVGGLTIAQAEALLAAEFPNGYDGKTLDLVLPSGETLSVSADLAGAGPDLDSAVLAAYTRGRDHGVIRGGAVYLISNLFSVNIPIEYALKQPDYVRRVVSEAAQKVDQPLRQTECRITKTEIRITKGITGLAVDQDGLYLQITNALSQADFSALSVSPAVSSYAETDLSDIWLKIHVEPQNAHFDKENRVVAAHVVGVSFDLTAAERMLKQAPEGSNLTIPFVYSDPEMTAEKLTAILFRDALGACKTNIGGTENRLSNVALASSFVQDTILMPGDEFSYNGVVGSRTTARGFLPAPAYVGGKTVDEIGGGICQVSSSVYLAALRANMKITERHPHMYAVGYLPDGMDATVYYGSLDFRFQNDTAFPIRIQVTISGRVLNVQIFGTKLDKIQTKIENKQISFDQFQTVYKADGTIPLGSETVDVTGYSGRKVEVYRSLYSDGVLLSRTLESVNTYKRRDKVVLVNPEDPRLAAPVVNAETDAVIYTEETVPVPLD